MELYIICILIALLATQYQIYLLNKRMTHEVYAILMAASKCIADALIKPNKSKKVK